MPSPSNTRRAMASRARPWLQTAPYRPTWRDRIGPALEILAGFLVVLLWLVAGWLWIGIAATAQVQP